MSRTQLAAAVGRGMDNIGAWEREDFAPNLASFFALQEALGCGPDDLMADNDPASVGEPGRHMSVSTGTTHGAGRRTHVEE